MAAVNRIRREHPALHYDTGLVFHATDNPQMVAYSRTSPDGASRVLVVVNVDPHNVQHGFIDVPIEALGADASTPYRVRDLLSGEVFSWQGARHYVRLDPAGVPAHILVLAA